MGPFCQCFKADFDTRLQDDHLRGVSPINRHLPPTHYLWKVQTYSLSFRVVEYKSGVFEVGGYKWRLSFYPNGDKENNGKDYISLYLEIDEIDTLSIGWEVNVSFKLFVHDQIKDKYLTFQDNSEGAVKRFHCLKTKWGFTQLISLKTFRDPLNGYLVDDSCAFGVEVFVIKPTDQKTESFSLLKGPNIDSSSTKEKLPRLDEDFNYQHEEESTIDGKNWKLQNYSYRSCSQKKKATSLYSIIGNLTRNLRKDRAFAYHELVNDETFEKAADRRPRTMWLGSGSKVNDQQFHQGVSRTKRNLPPAHYLLKVDPYSSISNAKEYESAAFESGGYKWKLLLYQNGDKKNKRAKYISLYLEIVETETFPPGWEVNVTFKLFVHEQINDKYLTVQGIDDGGVKRFHENKTRWGFERLLPLKAFRDPHNGYLVGDSCLFGAEVFIVKPTGKWECLSLVGEPGISLANNRFTWKIKNFTNGNKDFYSSPKFTIHERTWELHIFPNGYNDAEGKSVSVSLIHLPSSEGSSRKEQIYTEFKYRVYDQISGHHHEKRLYCYWPGKVSMCRNVISLKDLHNPSNGLIVKDFLIFEVEFLVMSKTTFFG